MVVVITLENPGGYMQTEKFVTSEYVKVIFWLVLPPVAEKYAVAHPCLIPKSSSSLNVKFIAGTPLEQFVINELTL
jgi:hypothetical protein